MSSYVQQNIGKGETLIQITRPHGIALLPHILLIPLFGLGLLTMIPVIIRLRTTVVAFSDKKIMCKTGLINTQKMDSPLSQVNNVVVSSGLFGKIFGFGTIAITTASGTHSFRGIKSAEKFRKALNEQIYLFSANK